jgi:hypothetical protein
MLLKAKNHKNVILVNNDLFLSIVSSPLLSRSTRRNSTYGENSILQNVLPTSLTCNHLTTSSPPQQSHLQG